MSAPEKIPALFVSPSGALKPVSGGLQIFTREQIAVLGAAGFDLTVIPFEIDMRFKTRLRRRLRPRPYANLLPPVLVELIVSEQRRTASRFVFFNVEETAAIAAELRQALAGAAPRLSGTAGRQRARRRSGDLELLRPPVVLLREGLQHQTRRRPGLAAACSHNGGWRARLHLV